MLIFKIIVGNYDFKFKVKIIVTNYGFLYLKKKSCKNYVITKIRLINILKIDLFLLFSFFF